MNCTEATPVVRHCARYVARGADCAELGEL